MASIPIDTRTLPSYTQKQLNELIVSAQGGCVESRDLVVEANLKLVLKIVHRFKGRDKEFEDLFQMGVIGLIKCVYNFDVDRGLRFSTYAFPMIIGEMKRYLRDHLGLLKVSRSIKETHQKMIRYVEQHVNENHQEPSIKQISVGIGVSEEDVLLALSAKVDFFSSNQKEGEERQLADDSEPMKQWELGEEIKRGLSRLTTTEKLIIEKRYFENKIQQEIAEELSISQAQVSRIERQSLSKLKTIM